MRAIDADKLKEHLKKLKAKADNKKYEQELQDAIDCYFPQIIDDAPTVDVQPVTWYTADENQPDSVGNDVLIVDHDGKYHVAYYCSKGNWIDTNTGNPIDVIKWRYLDGDSNEKRH